MSLSCSLPVAQDDPDEIYGTQRVVVAKEVKSAQRTPVKHAEQSASKKRKLNGETSAPKDIAATFHYKKKRINAAVMD